MTPTNRVLRASLAGVVLAACGDLDKQGPDSTDSTGTSSGTGSTTDVATTTGSSTTGSSTTGSSTGSGTSGDSTTAEATTGAPACDLVALTCEAAEVMGPVKDCGVVDPWNNTVAEWQAAVDCAITAAQAQQGFKLIVWLQGIDSNVGAGYYGVAAESYMLGTIDYDSYPPASAVHRACAGLSATPGCVVDLGQPCLSCDDAGSPEQRCDGA